MSKHHYSDNIKSSEITAEPIYYSRRNFLKLAGVVGAGTLLAACAGLPPRVVEDAAASPVVAGAASPDILTDEYGNPLTSYDLITRHNNYYEFTTSKRGVAELAKGFRTSPWEVQVSGLVNKPKTFTLEDILKKFTRQERIYRMRCVEAWSMVIPWTGFPLAELLKEVEPTSAAQYVRFETVFRPEEMPGLKDRSYPWPYQEGLRLDEAMHDLTLLATGIYGKDLLPQNGGPLRLVAPWKYGFKSIKSIVRIELVKEQPVTFWSAVNSAEYGFYSNVNPGKPHPRWSQAAEQRIGENGLVDTALFNGYEKQVAGLYQGMDLAKFY